MSIWKGFWFGGSVTVPGIRLVGGYVLNTGTTMDLNYELRYFVIDDSGNRHPSIGYEVQSFTYSYGQNDVNITSGAQSRDVTINVAETFNIISTSGFSFIVNPELSATLSGGAWSDDVPDQLINTDYTLVNLEDNIDFQGDNTVIYTLTDPNADTFSADNTIVLRYTPDIYIVAVDNNANVTDPVETPEYQVDLTYVLGGVFTTSAGLEWTGGTSATEPAVSLQPGDNNLVVGPYPDDFGNEESSFAQLVTKVPSLNYVGLTSIDAETFGTSYTATSGLEIDVDVGAPYATAIDETFIFTSGDYRTYDFDLSYSYPSQPSASATTSVSIDYTELAPTLDDLRINDGLVADLKFSPHYESIADTTVTPKQDTQSGVSIAMTGSGTNKLTYDPDQPNTGSLSRRFYNGQTMYQRERAWWVNNGDDFVPAIRYESSFNGVDDKIEIVGSEAWMPTGSDWTYHLTDRVTTLEIGTLLSKGINGSGNETEINMNGTGELSLVYGGVSCGVIATQEADIYNFITLKYNSTSKEITVWFDGEVLIDAFDVTGAQSNTSTIVKHCRRTGASTFDNYLNGYCHHDRYYDKMFDNKHKDAFFYNVYFSFMIPFSGDSTGGGVYRYLNNHYLYYGYGDGDDVFMMVANYGGRTFYDVSVPDDYTAPAYTTGGRPDLLEWETIGHSTSNVNHVVDRCLCNIYSRSLTQNWVGAEYYEGPEVYSEYMDALAAEKAICDSFNVPMILSGTIPQGVLDGGVDHLTTPAYLYMKPVDDQIKATYNSSIINDIWNSSLDERHWWVYNDINGASQADAFNDDPRFPSWENWKRFSDISHPSIAQYYRICRRWSDLYDSILDGLNLLPTYTDPRLTADAYFDAIDDTTIVYRDEPTESVEYIENKGTDLSIPNLKNLRCDHILRRNDYGNGIKSIGGTGLGEIAIVDLVDSKLWNTDEFTVSITFIRDVYSKASVDHTGLTSSNMWIANINAPEGDILELANPHNSGAVTKNAIGMNDSVDTDILYGKELVTYTYSAYMDGGTPKYRMSHSRLFDSEIIGGIRSFDVTSENTPLLLFAEHTRDANSNFEPSNYGITKDEIVKVSSWDRALSTAEIRSIEYFDKQLPFIANGDFEYYQESDYTPTAPVLPTLALVNSWACDAIVGDQLVDTVNGFNIDLFGTPSVENDGIVMNAVTDYGVLTGSEKTHLNPFESWTLSFQVKFKTSSQTTTSTGLIGAINRANGYGWSSGVRVTSNKLNGIPNSWSDPDTITKDVWINVQLVNDWVSGTTRMYFDGLQKATGARAKINSLPMSLMISSDDDVTFNADTTTTQIDTVIRNISYYCGAATQTEVNTINAGLPSV
jgi:hypothetical protein